MFDWVLNTFLIRKVQYMLGIGGLHVHGICSCRLVHRKVLHEVYNILGLPILMTVRRLVVSVEEYNRDSLSLFTVRVD